MQGSVNAAPRGGSIGTAIIGGIVGSLVTAAALVYVSPRYYASRIVRQGMLADPQILPDTADALRDAQYLPVLNANRKAIETPFGSSWKGAAIGCPLARESHSHFPDSGRMNSLLQRRTAWRIRWRFAGSVNSATARARSRDV